MALAALRTCGSSAPCTPAKHQSGCTFDSILAVLLLVLLG